MKFRAFLTMQGVAILACIVGVVVAAMAVLAPKAQGDTKTRMDDAGTAIFVCSYLDTHLGMDGFRALAEILNLPPNRWVMAVDPATRHGCPEHHENWWRYYTRTSMRFDFENNNLVVYPSIQGPGY